MYRFADNVVERSTTTTTGAYQLGGVPSGAEPGARTFVAGVGDTNTCDYYAREVDGSAWERGIGTVADAATDTLTRTTVLTSSNANAAVDWTGKTVEIIATLPARLLDPLGAFTAGSVLFSNGSGIGQDNANLFWDDTNNRLGIGTAAPSQTLHVRANTAVLEVEATTNNRKMQINPASGALDSVGTAMHINRNSGLAVAVGFSSTSRFRVGQAVEGVFGATALVYVGNTEAATPSVVIDKAPSMTADILQVRSTTGASGDILSIKASGNVGIGVTSPTAALQLKAGTASANTAPLKFTSGPLMTTPEAGAIEFLSDAFYATITTGAARKSIALLNTPAPSAAYTQTYATADKTHANPAQGAVATTAATNVSPYGYSTAAQADDIVTQLNNARTDILDLKQLVNSVIDDLQAFGLFA